MLERLVQSAVPQGVSLQLLVALGAALLLLLALVFLGKVPLTYNVRNLLVRWRITILTALAFTLVVGLLTVMLAFVNGMSKLTEASGQPGNVMVLSDGATDELFSNLAYSDTSNLERQPGVLKDSKGTPLCSKEVYSVVNQPIPNPAGVPQRRRFVQLRGIDEPLVSAAVHGLELFPGRRWFSEGGVACLPATS